MPRSGVYKRHGDDGHRDRSRSRSRDREENERPRGSSGKNRFEPSRITKDASRRDVHGKRESFEEERKVGIDEVRPGSRSETSLLSGSSRAIQDRKSDSLRSHADYGGDDDEDEDEEMMQLLGFSGFGSSKGKHIADNDKAAAGAANITKQRKYRQYMNRREGFNTALASVD